MALQEVGLSTEQEYAIVTNHFQDLKQHISDCIELEDFEVLSSHDVHKIKELYFTKSALFWKMKVEKVEERMDKIKHSNPFRYQQDTEFCELAIKKFTYYSEQKQAELKAKGDFYSFQKHHKPVIENQIMQWKMRLENQKQFGKLENDNHKVEAIP